MTDEKKTVEWVEPTTPKYLEAKASLPKELLPHFLLAVQWYQYFGLTLHNTKRVSYVILAEMVKEGFRHKDAT